MGGPIPGPPLCPGVPLDIHSPAADPFAELGRPDILLHLAWSGLPHYGSPHHLESELPAQLAFLSACVRSGIRRVVATGTCFEYGLALGEIEESQPLRPVTRYGDAKARLFEGMSLLRESVPFEFAWPRLFYLFGPGQSANSVYSQLHAAIERNDATFARYVRGRTSSRLPACRGGRNPSGGRRHSRRGCGRHQPLQRNPGETGRSSRPLDCRIRLINPHGTRPTAVP
ncbi:MAG: NAD(P)-dependent oxidoreductase [Thermomonas sp.]|nr:NAD(P)-dependent oxidoreductase [Thermomonas sp.]